MQLLSVLSVLIIAFVSVQITPVSGAKGRVVDLDARTFDSSLRDGNAWLIEFYAPWCGHCTRFAPTYEAVAKQLHEKYANSDRKVMVGKVDGSGDRALASRFNIRGFPSFFLIDGWTVREYTGTRSQEALIEFVTETYEDYEPIPYLNSPFGPMGQSRAYLMMMGTKTIDFHSAMVEFGFNSTLAAITIGFFGIMFGLITILVIGFMTLPKPKED